MNNSIKERIAAFDKWFSIFADSEKYGEQYVDVIYNDCRDTWMAALAWKDSQETK